MPLKMWKEHTSWEEAEQAWEDRAQQAREQHPIKSLKRLPKMPGMTPETAKHLQWKGLKWMVKHDKGWKILKSFLRHPFKYGWGLVKSWTQKRPYKREGDFYFYGVDDLDSFKKQLENPDSPFVVGFSYCHKPFECPSGRFTPDCIHDLENPVCRQCFIGKAMHALPTQNVIPVMIPTIHYIGDKIFEVVHENPGKKVLFLITACEMTLEMFADWGNMVGIQGIGVRLDGRICNTMQAFVLSEKGVKPGLTVVLDETQKQMLALIKHRAETTEKTTQTG